MDKDYKEYVEYRLDNHKDMIEKNGKMILELSGVIQKLVKPQKDKD